MSLIDEALKRLQASGQEGRPDAAERPWVPTPMPDAGLARRRLVARWAGIGAAVVAAAIVALLVVRRESAVAPEERSAAAAAPSPQPVREARAPASPVTHPAEAPAAVPAERAGASRTAAPPASREAAAERPGSKEGPVERAVEVRSPEATRRPRPVADGETFVGAVALPEGQRIELGGIVYSEADPRALLNDRILAAGAYVEGFTVSRIEPDRVALEKDGLTIYLVLK